MPRKGRQVFDFEWFTGHCYEEQLNEARWRCALRRFPDFDRDTGMNDPEFAQFFEALKTRSLIYLRDGFSYELRDVTDVASRGHLTFECEPVDEQYRVGCFVISVPFEDVVRVEIYAVPPDEMPDEMPAITGFRSRGDP
jgi:hypothetical protein